MFWFWWSEWICLAYIQEPADCEFPCTGASIDNVPYYDDELGNGYNCSGLCKLNPYKKCYDDDTCVAAHNPPYEDDVCMFDEFVYNPESEDNTFFTDYMFTFCFTRIYNLF